MQPASVPRPRTDEEHRAHLQANVAAAAAAPGHPGHWQLHHIALPGDSPSDFTPFSAPGYAEDAEAPHGALLHHLAEMLFGPGAGQPSPAWQATPDLEAGE
jgi:hypothetical protein